MGHINIVVITGAKQMQRKQDYSIQEVIQLPFSKLSTHKTTDHCGNTSSLEHQ
jgi:hypothetical protein